MPHNVDSIGGKNCRARAKILFVILFSSTYCFCSVNNVVFFGTMEGFDSARMHWDPVSDTSLSNRSSVADLSACFQTLSAPSGSPWNNNNSSQDSLGLGSGSSINWNPNFLSPCQSPNHLAAEMASLSSIQNILSNTSSVTTNPALSGGLSLNTLNLSNTSSNNGSNTHSRLLPQQKKNLYLNFSSNDPFIPLSLQLNNQSLMNNQFLNKQQQPQTLHQPSQQVQQSLQQPFSHHHHSSVCSSVSTTSNHTNSTSTTSISPASPTKSHKTNKVLFKTELCDSFQREGVCPYNDKCQFAHGLNELHNLSRSKNWKTKLCRNWLQNGFCRYGKRCCYKHGDTDDGSTVALLPPPSIVLKH